MIRFMPRDKKHIMVCVSLVVVFLPVLLLFSACGGSDQPSPTPTGSSKAGSENFAAGILLQYLAQTQTAMVHVMTATLNAPARPPAAQQSATPAPGMATAVYKTSPTVTPDFPVYKCGIKNFAAFGIVDVIEDKQVSISTCFFPPNKSFTIHMGTVGGGAVDDIVIGTYQTGKGGTFNATYKIPEKLAGSPTISLWATFEDGFSANNWFYNNNTKETK